MECSKQIQKYFDRIERETKEAHEIATKARKKSYDPEDQVDIKLAKNMAERVEGLISTVAPQIVGSGMTKRILELEKKYGTLSWEVALQIALEVAQEKFCKFKDKKEAMEVGIRAGFTYHTVGIVAAPLEGFVELRIKQRQDGKEYFSMVYAGPVRGAGGTAASVSVLIADYVRKNMGYSEYDPTEEETNRYFTELDDYHERVTNLQYHPSKDEVLFLAKNCPIEVNGDPTEEIEVSNYKDLKRVETNRIRGGMCLVFSMMALKAPKLWKRIEKWPEGSEFDMGQWQFVKEFMKIQKTIKAKESSSGEKGGKEEKLKPNYTYISDLVAGRPVLTDPMAKGGFRLRYGRGRTSGFSAASVHPVTMLLLNNYIAVGTQLKVERPGKAAAITTCDTIEGPTVKLENGNVIKIKTEQEARHYLPEIKEVLFLGDMMFNYGDFSENGHKLVPPGYCEEWWIQELEKKAIDLFGTIDYEKIAETIGIDVERTEQLLKNNLNGIKAEEAINISKTLNTPLHPEYTYHWKDITKEEFLPLFELMKKAETKKEEGRVRKIIIPFKEKEKRTLEKVGIQHALATNEYIVIEKDQAEIIQELILKNMDVDIKKETSVNETTLDILNSINEIKQRDKSGTYIGSRMGRPEKAKQRKLTGSPQVLFPVGKEGGRLRCFQSALDEGKINAQFSTHYCDKCKKETVYRRCEDCGTRTKIQYNCKQCGVKYEPCIHNPQPYKDMSINIKHYFEQALKKLKTRNYPDLIKGVRGTSNKDHAPEHLVKGILRAKHDIFVNKDGTIRYDCSELPITHFKAKELGVSVEKLKELGYELDIKGKPLENENQVLELRPQDIILPAATEGVDEPCDEVMFRVANFVDEMLEKLYEEKPFYNLKKKEDLIGHLVIGLAPHISAGMIGRIIGFSKTQGFFAHPMYHAAMRRDCDGDEACVILLMDAFLNFSKSYLPDRRGGRTMDAPLVLTSILLPSEVDDMVLGLDTVWKYPLEFYEAALEYKNPWDVKVEQINNRLFTEKQYEDIGYTHKTSDINDGITYSAYKLLPSMQEKLMGQMEIAEKVRAVDEVNVATLVIDKHFMKDIKGNLRKFSQQQFRCVKCNEKFRRPPLIGKCIKCNGKIIFTIAEGSVIKYLEPSLSLAKKYNLDPYLKQNLELTKKRIESAFGREKEKQEGLGKWFG